ncbi:hypothetical protein RM543_10255 [Roseicyclus sp. F158]|uniref:Uncharacterized protein n=1 Tax=Tropicimonas omnivorans TaxID=3075590 RepID=A0ABU3DHA5_9RHOB|nr:hypothetical protein [Roseicyclus sp. F158]MDT0683070.1 hypothetical protein [Roseicyclus sp. F158]
MKYVLSLAFTAGLTLSSAAQADEISDTLQSALDAYAEGDVAYALEELDFAKQRMTSLQASSFEEFLPSPLEGWTREMDNELQTGLAFMGGGIAAGANYTAPDNAQSYKVTIMADNAIVASMGTMAANAAQMGMRVERIGRQRIALGDDQALAFINNRVLITIDGKDQDLMMTVMEQIDFSGLSDFGS